MSLHIEIFFSLIPELFLSRHRMNKYSATQWQLHEKIIILSSEIYLPYGIHTIVFSKKEILHRRHHTLPLKKGEKGPLRTCRLQHIMPPNLLSSFSAISPHLSLTIYFGNKHRDPSNDSPVWVRLAFIHLSELNCSAGCMLFSQHKIWQYAMWCHYLTWLQHSVLKNARKINTKYQYTFFNLTNRELTENILLWRLHSLQVQTFSGRSQVYNLFACSLVGPISPPVLPENTVS